MEFKDLGLVVNDQKKTVKFNDKEFTVRQYLPIEEKLALISRVMNLSHDTSFANPVKVEIYGHLEMVFTYTDIEFTEEEVENTGTLYDLLECSGLLAAIIEAIPQAEYDFMVQSIEESITAYYAYENSALGILNSISEDYSNLNLDVDKLTEKLKSEDLQTVKEIVTKLG